MPGAAAYRGSRTVSADECKRVHTLGSRGAALGANSGIVRYTYQGRPYVLQEKRSIKGRLVITAQKFGR